MPPSANEVRAGLLTLQVEEDGNTRLIRLAGELDLASASVLDTELDAALADGHCQILVDMRELTFIDSTGIAIVAAALGQASDGKRLRFIPSPAPGVSRVLELTGIAERLPLADGVADGAVEVP